MRAINHAMTGAVIGLVVGNAWIAVPAAIASHFVLDAMPHFGEKEDNLLSPLFTRLLILDALLCALLVGIIVLAQPTHWLLAALCAFLAAGVDFTQLPRYVYLRRHGVLPKKGLLMRFHGWIQWYQQPPGAFIELAWATIAIIVLIKLHA